MDSFKEEMISRLKDLKENYGVVALKTEFESEGARFDEALLLKEMASVVGLEFVVKIGGCEAVKDIYDAKSLGADVVVAPMIESFYAAKKFVNAVSKIFPQKLNVYTKFMINIETVNGFEHLNEILGSDISKNLYGIVFGRTDMAGSLNKDGSFVNSDKMLDYAQKILSMADYYGKKVVIGGGVCPKSVPFFKKLNYGVFEKFETRKVVFDADFALNNSDVEEGILKALEFEIMWIKGKNLTSFEDAKRVDVLVQRVKNGYLSDVSIP